MGSRSRGVAQQITIGDFCIERRGQAGEGREGGGFGVCGGEFITKLVYLHLVQPLSNSVAIF